MCLSKPTGPSIQSSSSSSSFLKSYCGSLRLCVCCFCSFSLSHIKFRILKYNRDGAAAYQQCNHYIKGTWCSSMFLPKHTFPVLYQQRVISEPVAFSNVLKEEYQTWLLQSSCKCCLIITKRLNIWMQFVFFKKNISVEQHCYLPPALHYSVSGCSAHHGNKLGSCNQHVKYPSLLWPPA